jgi:hypothetical protein
MCGQSLKIVFWKFEKSPWEHYMSKIKIKIEINSYIFKVATTKFSWKFTMFQKSFYTFKTHKKNMWITFFCIKSPFPLLNVHQIVSIFLWTLIYSKRRDPCVENIIYIYTFLDLNIQMSYYSFTLL